MPGCRGRLYSCRGSVHARGSPRCRIAIMILRRGVLLLILAWTSLAAAEEGLDFRAANLRLLDAARAGDVREVQRLLDGGASVKARNRFGATPLFLAARGGHTAIVRVLLAAGAEVDQPNLEQTTPLIEAVHQGQLETALLLIERGADVNHVDLRLLSPLMHAAFAGHEPLVRLLLARGARPDL